MSEADAERPESDGAGAPFCEGAGLSACTPSGSGWAACVWAGSLSEGEDTAAAACSALPAAAFLFFLFFFALGLLAGVEATWAGEERGCFWALPCAGAGAAPPRKKSARERTTTRPRRTWVRMSMTGGGKV